LMKIKISIPYYYVTFSLPPMLEMT
jgi:hypothetical protein